MTVDLDVSARRLAIFLLAVIAVLVTGHLLGWLFEYVLDHDHVFGLIALFNLGAEQNVPTWFSSLILLSAGGLCALIGLDARHREETSSTPWFGLGGIFLFLSWDEIFGIHDRIGLAMHDGALATGIFFYAWVIPYGALCAVLAALYLPFVWRLPPTTRKLFILAGGIFVGGALGLELVAGTIDEVETWDNWATRGLVVIEEIAEMGGIVLFIYALLDYMRRIDMVVVFNPKH